MRILSILLVTGGLWFFTGTFCSAQHYIGMHKDEVIQTMKDSHKRLKLNTSVVNPHYNYLKFEDRINEITMLFFLSDKDICTNIRETYSWQLRYQLDLDLMNQGAEIIRQTKDFTSFSKLHTDVKTHICQIKSANWLKQDAELVFSVTADRFLRNMVRALVGTLVCLGRNKLSICDLERIIESKDRSEAGESAPAKGLFLHKIEYPYNL